MRRERRLKAVLDQYQSDLRKLKLKDLLQAIRES